MRISSDKKGWPTRGAGRICPDIIVRTCRNVYIKTSWSYQFIFSSPDKPIIFMVLYQQLTVMRSGGSNRQ
jgi:hypothetical protein